MTGPPSTKASFRGITPAKIGSGRAGVHFYGQRNGAWMERGRLGSKCCSPLRGLSTVPPLKPPARSLPKTNDFCPRLPCPAPARSRPASLGGSSRLQLHRGPPAARAMPTHWLPSCRARPCGPPRPPTHVCMWARVCSPRAPGPGPFCLCVAVSGRVSVRAHL